MLAHAHPHWLLGSPWAILPTMTRQEFADFSRLFDQHAHLVYRRALRILGHPADAEEAVQEVFIRAMRAYDSFEGDSKVTTWLYQITTNYCLNFIRDQARRRALLNERAPNPEATATTSPELILLRQLLLEAEPREAQAAIYVLLDGMTQAQAAPLLGVSPRSVGNLVDRFTSWARKRAAR